MRYLIFVGDGEDESATPYAAPVPATDRAYLRRALATLRPLSDEQYASAHAAILNTLARFSYVVDDGNVYWCVEWAPGLVIVRLGPGTMAATALRSPNPEFGGRQPTPEDLAADYDEDDENPQYDLVFRAWDSQFDDDDRRENRFKRADARTVAAFQEVIARLDELATRVVPDDATARRAWHSQCLRNLEAWAGEGLRLR